jgi:hypothetical protein
MTMPVNTRRAKDRKYPSGTRGEAIRRSTAVAVLLTGLGAVSLGVVAIHGQRATVPKTPWGEPDLQGLWLENTQTPLQRPARYAGREFLTDAERAAEEKRQLEGRKSLDVALPPGDERFQAYGSVYFESRPAGRRTSLIVDPPDGQLPALTPEAQARAATFRAYQLALLQATDACKNQFSVCKGGTYGPPSPRRAEAPPFYLYGGAVGGVTMTTSVYGVTNSGGEINRSDGPEDRDLGERCLVSGFPNLGTTFEIVQGPGVVSIFYELIQGQGFARSIPITTQPHLPPHVRRWWGDSRGRWEGNTLVVDVTNFSPKSDFMGSHEHLHVVERFTPLGKDVLEYQATIEDPQRWVRPWTVRQELNRQSAYENRFYLEPRCHEGNRGMVGMLLGARAEDKAFAEGKGPHPATRCHGVCGYGRDPDGR